MEQSRHASRFTLVAATRRHRAALAGERRRPAAASAARRRSAAPAETITTSRQRRPPLTQQFGDYGDTAGRWTGADSAYSVALPGGKIAWLYSDTFLGDVNADHSPAASTRRSSTTRSSSTTTARSRPTPAARPAAPESLVTVAGGDESQDWYWFGDGTVEGNAPAGDPARVRQDRRPASFDFAFERTRRRVLLAAEHALRGHHAAAGRHGGMGIRDLRGQRLHLRVRRRGPRRDEVPAPRAGRRRRSRRPVRGSTSADAGWSADEAHVEAHHGGRVERVQREQVPGQVHARDRRHHRDPELEDRHVSQRCARRAR